MPREWLTDAFDDLDQLVSAVTLLTGEADKLAGASEDGAALWCPCNVNAPAAPELKHPFVAEQAQGTKDGVRVDPKHRGEVAGRRQPFSRFGLAVGDSPADLGGDLLEEVGLLLAVDLDANHRDIHTSTT